MKVNRKEILAVVTKLGKLKSNKSMPQTDEVLMRYQSDKDILKISRNNLDIELSYYLPCAEGKGFEAAINVADFKKLLEKLKADFIELINLPNNMLEVRHMKGSTKFESSDIDLMPTFKTSGEKFITYFTNVKDLLKASKYVIKDEFRYALTGVYFSNSSGVLEMYATDAYKLIKVTTKSNINEESFEGFIMPSSAVPFIEDGSIYTYESGHVSFMCNGFDITFKPLDIRYPDCNMVIPTNNDVTATVNVKDLLEAIDVVSLSANAVTNGIKLNFNDNQVSAEDIDFSRESNYDVEFVCSEPLEEKFFNYIFLTHILKDLNNGFAKLQCSHRRDFPLVIEEENTLYLIMPVAKW